MFPSAISRYLVSDNTTASESNWQMSSFHPQYRGTWYLTATIQATRTTTKVGYSDFMVEKGL